MKRLIFLWLCLSQSVFAANYTDGMEAYNQTLYQDAYDIWLPLAENGNGIAQYSIGVMHEHGYGVEADIKEAFEWYHLSAESGYSKVQHALGNAYYFGKGVEKDYKKAVYWWDKAARQKVVGSQHNLGVFYLYGEKAYRDRSKGQYWLRLSAEAGHVPSQKILARLDPSNKKAADKQAVQQKYSRPKSNEKPTTAPADTGTKAAVKSPESSPPKKSSPAAKHKKQSGRLASKNNPPKKQAGKKSASSAKPYDWISAQPLTNYTIQLTVQPSKKTALAYVREHNLRGRAFIYSIGANTHKIIMGSYRGYSKAVATIKKLPASLQKDEPWVKSFAKVKKERRQ